MLGRGRSFLVRQVIRDAVGQLSGLGEDLAAALSAASVKENAVPLAIVPFDQDSSLGEVGRVVIPLVVMNLVRGSAVVTPEGIIQTTRGLCIDAMRSTGAG